MFLLYAFLSLNVLIPYHYGYSILDSLTNSLVEEAIGSMGDGNMFSGDYDNNALVNYDLNSNPALEEKVLEQKLKSARTAKEYGNRHSRTRNDKLFDREQTTRDQEYLEHSSLLGHQHMQGGAGEGFQRLKPDGSMKNSQILKTDILLPSYCNPPNPCPLGYTSKDGCLEDFVNTADFSREYQEAEDCMCDADHMFECPERTNQRGTDIQGELFGNLNNIDSSVLAQLSEEIGLKIDAAHKTPLVKKFSARKRKNRNPYLHGEKLPVVAKKSPKEK